MSRTGRVRFVAIWALATLGFLYLWVVLFAVGGSRLVEARDQHALYDRLRQEFALETAPTGGAIDPGSPVAVLRSSILGGQQVIVEGTASADLRNGPGHVRDTPLPGQIGTSVIFGRAVTYGGPFGSLDRARVGDTITALTQQGTFTYRVIDVRVAGSALPPAVPAAGGRLTLVSAEGSGWRAGWAANRAVLVDADLVGKAVPATEPHVVAVPPEEAAFATDPGGLLPLVDWLVGGLAAALATTWAWARWGKWQTWLIGSPLVLACLWGATSAGSELLPNLL